MSKGNWLILTAVVLLVFTAAKGFWGLLLGAAIVGVPYLLSCVFHPRTIHRGCNGTGYHRSALFPWATRKCRGCQGGIQVRYGSRVVGLPHVQAEHRRRTKEIGKNQANRTWR